MCTSRLYVIKLDSDGCYTMMLSDATFWAMLYDDDILDIRHQGNISVEL